MLLIVLVSTTIPLIFLFLSFYRRGSVSRFNSSLGRLGQSDAGNPGASRLGLLLSWWLSPSRREVSDSTGWHLLFDASVSFDHNCGIRLSWNLLATWPKRLQAAARRSPCDKAQSHSQACQGHWECHCCVPRLGELLCSALLNKPLLLVSL